MSRPRTVRRLVVAVAGLLLVAEVALATEPGEGYTRLGTVQPRAAREIAGSNWSVGAETMDRDFTIYENWKEYLGPLGAKKARLQCGWAKTEPRRGEFQWQWLDAITDWEMKRYFEII